MRGKRGEKTAVILTPKDAQWFEVFLLPPCYGTGWGRKAYCFSDWMEAEMRVNQGSAAMLAAAIGVSMMLSGCRVENDKHGDSDNVKIATPFGGMSVKTNEAAGVDAIGLPIYPGAVMVKKKDKNDGAADINLSFGSFSLKVKAASYTTPDSPDLVAAFYRKALGRYGDVIECQNDKAVSSQTRTAEGLTCADDQRNHIKVDNDMSGKMELKAGSKQHQHIVGIDPDGSGTKIGMVALDLPGHLSGDGDDSTKE
jgi:hypothetical protein